MDWSDGSGVQYLGVNCGRVATVRRKQDGSGVIIDALIDQTPPLPANIRAVISSSNALGGTATLNIDIDGEKAEGKLEPSSKPIFAKYVGLQLNFLPPEISASMKQVGDMSEEFRKTAQQLRESNTIKDLDGAVLQIRDTIAKAGTVMDSLNKTVGDPKTVEDFRTALTSIRQAAEECLNRRDRQDGNAGGQAGEEFWMMFR